ncbi:tetratricopeptide repeat protein [Actinoplanes philippinensis]|uniref:tetratricopeptide repeat protein n=1 Tax=Actinoplanes philippinensis TaxID=35752 RepID=UPI001160ACF7|nr:tetratricopeptide repeat protein [Actinoplanes philippinensis]
MSRSPLTPAIERARALIASGDLGSAQVLLERAVELGRENLGEDEPDVLTAQRELAGVFLRSDDPMAARRVLEDAYAAGQWRLGDGDPVMLHISHDLGIVAQELGNRHEARKAFGRVAANGPAALGEGHEFVVRARSYLGEDPSGATVRPDAPTIQPTTTPAPAPPPPPVTPAADVPPPMTPVTHTPPPVTPVTSPPPALTPVAGPPPPMTPLPSTLPPVTPVTSTPPPMAPVTHTAPPVAPVTHTPPAVAPVTNVPPVTPAANVRPPVTSVGHGPAPLPPFTHLPPAVSKDGPVGHMARDTAGGEGPGARSALERPTDVLPVTRTAPAQRAETTFVGQPDVTVQRAGNPWDAAPVVPVQRQAPVERHGHDVVPQSRHVGPPPVRHDAYQGGYGTVDNPHAVHQGGYPQQHHGTVQSTGWSTSPQQDSAAGGPYRRKGRGLAVGLTVVATLVALTAVGALVFVLVGRDDDGPVTPVATASAGVPQLAGDPPTGVKLKDRGASVDVTWKDPSDGKVPFIVTMARNGQQHSSMARVDLGRTKTTISGLNPNLEYCFAVVAVYSSDRFASSNQVCLGRK